MPLKILVTKTTGGTLKATLKRRSDGYRWSVLASAWQASPTYTNSKITLAEGSSEYAGQYSASVSGLGDAGIIDIYIHDATASDVVIGVSVANVMGGDEVTSSGGGGISLNSNEERKFKRLLNQVYEGTIVTDSENNARIFKTGCTSKSLVGAVIVFADDAAAANAGVTRRVMAHNTTTGKITVDVGFPETPTVGDVIFFTGYQSSVT